MSRDPRDISGVQSTADALHSKSNMAAEFEDHFPRLEDLCIRFVSANGNLWNPKVFLGIPRHLLLPILEKFQPFDVERLEVTGIFQTVGLDTDQLWKKFYLHCWPRKSKWPDVYFTKKGIPKGGESWRICYLQRCLQDSLNCQGDPDKERSCSSRADFNADCIPCDSVVPSKNQSLKNTVALCGRYATYLRLYNSAVILLFENLDLCFKLVDYIEFLEVFLLRNNGVNQLCHLLQLLTSRRLKSVGFCFSKVSGAELWDRIFDSLSTKGLPNQTYEEEDNFISTCTCTSSPTSKHKALIGESKLSAEQTCNQSNCGHRKTASDKISGVQVGSLLNDCTDLNKEITLESSHKNDDIDIYAFDEWNDLPKTPESTVSVSFRGFKEGVGDTNYVSLSSDLYDEVFGQSTCRQPSDIMPTKLFPGEIQGLQQSSEPCTWDSTITCFPRQTCFLVHFELVGFRLYSDLFAMFVHTLKTWLALETIILQDNGLDLVSTPGREFIETLSFLCTNGRLQSLQITDNPVSDEFTKLLFERLVVSLCCKCHKDCNCSLRYLTKLKFSSNKVSPGTSVYFGKSLGDVCRCNVPVSKQFLEKMFDSVLPSSDSAMSTEDLTHKSFSELKNSYVSHCLACQSGTSGRKVTYSTGSYNHGTQKPPVGCKINTEPTEPTGSTESFSQNKNPLLSKSGKCDVFVGIQVMKLSCVVGQKGATFIAEGLKRNSTLHSLSLTDCDINTVGLAKIFQALSGEKHHVKDPSSTTIISILCVYHVMSESE